MMLITLDQAKRNLRVVHSDEDEDIVELIEEASAAVVAYLKTGADAFLDSSGAPTPIEGNSPSEIIGYDVPPQVRRAVKILVGALYRNRDSTDPERDGWKDGFLPPPVMAILYPLRDPALA